MTHLLDKIEFMEGSIELLHKYMRAKYMERKNINKPIPMAGYDSAYSMIQDLRNELMEVTDAFGFIDTDDDLILRELADVANYCALIAGALMRRSE